MGRRLSEEERRRISERQRGKRRGPYRKRVTAVAGLPNTQPKAVSLGEEKDVAANAAALMALAEDIAVEAVSGWEDGFSHLASPMTMDEFWRDVREARERLQAAWDVYMRLPREANPAWTGVYSVSN